MCNLLTLLLILNSATNSGRPFYNLLLNVFSGAWLLSGLGGALYGALLNSTQSSSFGVWSTGNSIRTERDVSGFNSPKDHDAASINIQSDRKSVVEEKIVKITEKIYMKPPSAEDIAGSFTKEQLEAIALAVKNFLNVDNDLDSDKLVQKIVNNPSFVNIINNQQDYHKDSKKEDSSSIHEELLNKQQILIDTLLKELDKMRGEIITNNKLRSEEYARLSLDMKRCCNKRPVINVEGYVSRAVTDLLNNPQFLNNQQGLNNWLHSLFLAKQDLEYHLGNLTARMESKLAAVVESNSQQLMDNVAAKLIQTTEEKVVKREVSQIDDVAVKKIVKDALAIYDADRTGMVDYAMESMGGQVVTIRCTEPYHYGKAVVSVLGIPLWHSSNSPRTVVTPTIAPGDCWAFQNFPGFLVVKLSNKIRVDAFSIEHISKLLLPDGRMDSAPKEFEVYGLKEENDRDPVLLGSYKYDENGEPLQFFLVQKDNQIFDMIEIRIVSNHGNPNYTCLYRFRVHGKLHHEDHR